MLKFCSRQNNPGLVAGLFCFYLLFLLSTVTLDSARTRRPVGYLTPPEIQHFTFGMKEQVADFLWLRALQDFEYCEHLVREGYCEGQGWLFRMLDLVTDLSPRFRMPYAVGGLALGVLANDQEGASRIFDKAALNFPKDWPILSRAAYHALIEEKNGAKAARLAKAAAENGAPAWFYLLANRAASQDGDYEFTEEMIRQLESAENKDDALIKNLRRRLENVKAGRPIDSGQPKAK